MVFKLRDYQIQVKREIYQHFRSNKSVLVSACTGSGKSIIIAQMIHDAMTKGKRSLVIVHRKKLVSQLAATIEAFSNYKPAIINPGNKPDHDNLIQVAMAQTLQNRELPPNVELLICDEAHITSYMQIWRDCMDRYCGSIWCLGKCFVVGLSGSPWRTKRKEGFCQFFDVVVKAPSARQLISMGYLTHPLMYTYDLIDLSTLETDDDGEYTLSALQRACTHEYNSDVINKWETLGRDRKTTFFCVSVKQAEDLHQQLLELNYTSELITGKTSSKDAKEIFERFAKAETQCLVSIGTLTEGFDDPGIGAVVIARPTRSLCLFTQIVGRGLRIDDGKQDVYIIDCGGCIQWLITKCFGGNQYDDPINIDYIPLCPEPPLDPLPEVKECPSCAAEVKRWIKICPECGFEFPDKSKLETPPKIEFPELVPYFSKEGIRQYHFLRRRVVKAFRDRKSPETVLKDFYKQYNIIAPKDYFLGAIFGLKDVEVNTGIYRKSLESLGLNPLQVQCYLQFEFGEYGRTYKIPTGTYTRPKQEKPFQPWLILGLTETASRADIKQAYQLASATTENEHRLNTALMLCLDTK